MINRVMIRWWRYQQKKQGVVIHKQANFTGVGPGDKFVRIGRGAIISIGSELYIDYHLEGLPSINIGQRSYIGQYNNIGAYCPITIGNDVMIGPFSHILSGNHRFERRDIPMSHQGHLVAPVIIEDDVWLGTHVVVLPGVTIGKGSIVAAGAVVNKDIPPYEIWGGVPAKFIKARPG